jgi:hypothetical protein
MSEHPRPRTGWGAHPHKLAVLLARRSTAKVTLPRLRFLETPLDDCPKKDRLLDSRRRGNAVSQGKNTPREGHANYRFSDS